MIIEEADSMQQNGRMISINPKFKKWPGVQRILVQEKDGWRTWSSAKKEKERREMVPLISFSILWSKAGPL